MNGTLLKDNLATLIKSLRHFIPFDIVIPHLEIYPKAVVSTLAIYQEESLVRLLYELQISGPHSREIMILSIWDKVWESGF